MWLIVVIGQNIQEPQMGRHGRPTSERGPSASQARTAADAVLTRRTIRRSDLFKLIPLAKSTIYRMEQRGEFPRQFFLTARCVVWDLSEVEAWIDERRRASASAQIETGPFPDAQKRKRRVATSPRSFMSNG
jgi:prophage regulatory protein